MAKQKVDKQQIIKDALIVFKNQGYHKTTMADVGKACGLLKGSIYHYFNSKEELMSDVLEFLSNYYHTKLFSIKNNQETSPEEKIKFLIEKSEELFLKDKGGCLMASIGLETVHVIPKFTNQIKLFFNDWINCFEQIFLEIYSETKAKELAEMGVAQIEGAVLLMQIFQNEEYLHKAHQHILQLTKIPE